MPWGLEALTTLALLGVKDARIDRRLSIFGAVLFGAIVIVTAGWAAPIHGELVNAGGFDSELHQDLMGWNLVRTALWTLRGAVAVALVYQALSQIRTRL